MGQPASPRASVGDQRPVSVRVFECSRLRLPPRLIPHSCRSVADCSWRIARAGPAHPPFAKRPFDIGCIPLDTRLPCECDVIVIANADVYVIASRVSGGTSVGTRARTIEAACDAMRAEAKPPVEPTMGTEYTPSFDGTRAPFPGRSPLFTRPQWLAGRSLFSLPLPILFLDHIPLPSRPSYHARCTSRSESATLCFRLLAHSPPIVDAGRSSHLHARLQISISLASTHVRSPSPPATRSQCQSWIELVAVVPLGLTL